MSKFFIRILVLACLLIVVWTGYVFFHNEATVINGVILVVDIGVLIWNFSVMRKMHIGFGSVVLTGAIIAAIALPAMAFANIEPAKSWKDSLLQQTQSITSVTTNVASVGRMGMYVRQDTRYPFDTYYLHVSLVPTSRAEANTIYLVDLYEKGNLRASKSISWSQPEINVLAPKIASFQISYSEYITYQQAENPEMITLDDVKKAMQGGDNGWWRGIFSIKVHEPSN